MTEDEAIQEAWERYRDTNVPQLVFRKYRRKSILVKRLGFGDG